MIVNHFECIRVTMEVIRSLLSRLVVIVLFNSEATCAGTLPHEPINLLFADCEDREPTVGSLSMRCYNWNVEWGELLTEISSLVVWVKFVLPHLVMVFSSDALLTHATIVEHTINGLIQIRLDILAPLCDRLVLGVHRLYRGVLIFAHLDDQFFNVRIKLLFDRSAQVGVQSVPDVLIVRRVGIETWGPCFERMEVNLLKFILEPIQIDVLLRIRCVFVARF